VTNWLKEWVLRLMRVPAEPHPPFGEEGSVRIFRASRRFLQFNILRWGLRQAAVLTGILFALAALGAAEYGERRLQQVADSPPVQEDSARGDLHEIAEQLKTGDAFLDADQIFALFHLIEVLSLLAFVLQLPATYMLVRLDYELRWYIVTDRSLRIREGIVRVNELTLTFANVQEVSIRQNPIQRLLGISDLRVQTAGGGGSPRRGPGSHRQEESGHIGYFHGLDDAEAVRDLILNRMRQLRDAGLGDTDAAAPEPTPAPTHTAAPAFAGSPPLAAAREMLVEAQALRRAVTARSLGEDG